MPRHHPARGVAGVGHDAVVPVHGSDRCGFMGNHIATLTVDDMLRPEQAASMQHGQQS
jgi:hypothetical protein